MPQLKIIKRDGEEVVTDAPDGSVIMEVIREAGCHELQAICGGCCSCATCHVFVEDAFLELLPEMADDEDGLLDISDNRQRGSRLSCQLKLTPALDGMRVTIAPDE